MQSKVASPRVILTKHAKDRIAQRVPRWKGYMPNKSTPEEWLVERVAHEIAAGNAKTVLMGRVLTTYVMVGQYKCVVKESPDGWKKKWSIVTILRPAAREPEETNLLAPQEEQ